MNRIVAQGDLLIERVADAIPSRPQQLPAGTDGAVVLAEGETTGHRHVIWDRVTMFRDESLARDIPDGLYIGHVRVANPDGATVVHEEHDPLHLSEGTYRVRRQREMEPQDVQLVRD
jgi:hypothetical protein